VDDKRNEATLRAFVAVRSPARRRWDVESNRLPGEYAVRGAVHQGSPRSVQRPSGCGVWVALRSMEAAFRPGRDSVAARIALRIVRSSTETEGGKARQRYATPGCATSLRS